MGVGVCQIEDTITDALMDLMNDQLAHVGRTHAPLGCFADQQTGQLTNADFCSDEQAEQCEAVPRPESPLRYGAKAALTTSHGGTMLTAAGTTAALASSAVPLASFALLTHPSGTPSDCIRWGDRVIVVNGDEDECTADCSALTVTGAEGGEGDTFTDRLRFLQTKQ